MISIGLNSEVQSATVDATATIFKCVEWSRLRTAGPVYLTMVAVLFPAREMQ